MANRRVDRAGSGNGGRDGNAWDRGPLGRIPKRYLRRPLKGLPVLVTVPSMLWRARRGRLDDLRLPNFIGIGAPRAGTTWLHFNLAAHPDICMPSNRKEQRFWNHNLSRGIDAYAGAFSCSQSQVMGEISPTYSTMDPWRRKLMARMMPDVKIIYLIRNPIHRTWSHLSLWAKSSGRDATTLPEDEIRSALASEEFAQASAYADVYARYCETFSPQQIFVGFYDDIEADPRGLLRSVFGHVGVTDEVAWDSFPLGYRVNSGLVDEAQAADTSSVLPERWRGFLATQLADQLNDSARVFGGHAERWAADAAG